MWSRDGKTIAYRSLAGVGGLYLKEADGLKAEHPLFLVGHQINGFGNVGKIDTTNSLDIIPNSWTPDDKQILCSFQTSGKYSRSLLVLIPADGGTPAQFLPGDASN